MAEELALTLHKINQLIDSGQAHAALHTDDEARHQCKVSGSPKLTLSEGWQLLDGNVDYRFPDANVREFLHNTDHGKASWY